MIVRQIKNYELDCTVSKPAYGNALCVEFRQFWPEAQRPHWRRIAQLNLSPREMFNLGVYLIAESNKEKQHDRLVA